MGNAFSSALSSDAQAVINEQLGDDYDVFLGILWGRFGTPTPRASSGTHEEFLRALSRRRKGDMPEIMVYFKDAPVHPSRIDPDQLSKVHKFKSSLAELGALYSTFDDLAGFESSVRSHLSMLAQKFTSKPERATVIEAQPDVRDVAELVDDASLDLGFLDWIETYEGRIGEMNSTLTILADATVRMGELMNRRASEITDLGRPVRDAAAARAVLKRAAADLQSYADILAGHMPSFSSSRTAALDALSNALALRSDFPESEPDELQNLKGALSRLLESVQGSRTGLVSFRDTTQGFPRLTAELNRAKRAATTQLTILLNELDKTSSTVTNILESVERMLREQ